MKKIGKIVAPILILLAMSIIGYLLLVLVYSIDTDRMQYNAGQSAKTFAQEGMYPQLQENYSSQLDSYTDALMILTAVHHTNESVWQAAINNERQIVRGRSPEEVIQLVYFENAEAEDAEYSRYWHGYLLLLKPALCFLSYKEIRYFVMAIEVLLFAVLLGLLCKRNDRFALPIALTWLFVNPVSTMMSLQFCYVTCIAFLGAIIVAFLEGRRKETSLYLYGIVFMIIGAATSYMDLLTFPLITLGIPLAIWIVLRYMRKEKQSFKNTKMQRIIQTIYLSAFWTIGYGGFWALKWIIGNIVTGRDIIGRAFEQVELRAGGMAATAEVSFGTTMKYVIWDVNPYFIILFVTFAVIVVLSKVVTIINKKENKAFYDTKKKLIWEYVIPLFIISVYPFVWYRVVFQHTYCHYWFTYREMAITVLAISLLLGNIAIDKSK